MQTTQTEQKKQCVPGAVMEVFVSISTCMSCAQGVISCWKEMDAIDEMCTAGLATTLNALYYRVAEMDKAVALEGCPCGQVPLDGHPQEIKDEIQCVIRGEKPPSVRSADVCLMEIQYHMAAVFASSEGVIRLLTKDNIQVPKDVAEQMANGLRFSVATAQIALDDLIQALQTNRQIKQAESQQSGGQQTASRQASSKQNGRNGAGTDSK